MWCWRCSRWPWKRHSPRRVRCSRAQPGTKQSCPRVNATARAMNASMGSGLAVRHLRSCRKHNPAQCSSLSQPVTAQSPTGSSGRVGWVGGAASKSSQPTPSVVRARRQPSQRRRWKRVAVGHPGVQHGHAAVRWLASSPENSSAPTQRPCSPLWRPGTMRRPSPGRR